VVRAGNNRKAGVREFLDEFSEGSYGTVIVMVATDNNDRTSYKGQFGTV
jgi:hypothetical protein